MFQEGFKLEREERLLLVDDHPPEACANDLLDMPGEILPHPRRRVDQGGEGVLVRRDHAAVVSLRQHAQEEVLGLKR